MNRTLIERWQGITVFGHAYQYMLQHDAHTEGSVDRVLAHRMIRVCPETAAFLYGEYTSTQLDHESGSRPVLEQVVAQIIPEKASQPQRITAIAHFTAHLGEHAPQGLDRMLLGGREEDIIERGSNWCTDVARVACVLCQIDSIPARIVYLFDLRHAYSGHAIIEAYRDGQWGAVCPTTGVVFTKADQPVSTWELVCQPALALRHPAFYPGPDQFSAAAIVNYACWEAGQYDYTISTLNQYYRTILEMSAVGWPGGLHWLQGENQR